MPNLRSWTASAIVMALGASAGCSDRGSIIHRSLSERGRTGDAGAASTAERPVYGLGGRGGGGDPSGGGDSPRGNGAPGEPLPDLVLDAAYLIDTLAFDRVRVDDPCLLAEGCVTGLGERSVVRFGSRTGNVGEADFVLGKPGETNPLWTRDSCQGSFDLVGFARYELLHPSSGERVLAGNKHGFCIADAEAWDPESGQRCEVYDCGYQGISPGCADNYGAELLCQWVDVTDVARGVYDLRVTINADREIPESDYANNTVEVRVEIDDQTVGIE